MKVQSLMDDLQRQIKDSVSRETWDRFEIYADELRRWNQNLNLVSRASLDDLWKRHIADSCQLIRFADRSGHWADLGTGGGIPGLIVAALRPNQSQSLLESDQRKCAFLQSTAMKMDLNVNIVSERIEKADPLNADVITARALAPLEQLLHYGSRHLRKGGVCLFLKGRTARDELTKAEKAWKMDVEVLDSATSSESAILRIGAFSRV